MKTKEIKNKNKIFENKTTLHPKEKGVIVFAFLCILLFYPPFFKGLFFQKEILLTHILSFGLFIIYLINKITRGEKVTFNNPFDYIALLFIIAYFLPIIFRQWANLRDAIGIMLRYINFFVIYLMVKDYAKEKKYKDWILDVFILSGVVTALIGLLGAAGYVNLQDVVLSNRISSTFQYPNTLAAFLMTLFFTTTGKQAIEKKLWKKNFYATSGFMMIFTFVFTYSRAAWIIFPVFALLYLIILPGIERLKVTFYYIAAALPSLLLLQPFGNYITSVEGKNPKVIMIVIVGIVIFVGIYTALQCLIEKFQQKHYNRVYIVLGAIIIIITMLAIIALNVTAPLIFDNTNVTENRMNEIHRLVRNIEPDQHYILKINVETINNEEADWPWRVRLFGFDEKGQRHALLTRNGEVGEGDNILIPFTTSQDTKDLSIYFDNLYVGTKAIFNEAKLLSESEEIIQNIKLSYRFIPESIISRFNVFDLNQQSFTTRTAYYRDSFTIFKSYPIFGAGGGAWNELYAKYQSQPYFSTETHNYFLQTLVELGLVGVVLMTTLIGTILVLFIYTVRKRQLMEMTILFSIISLLTHSVLDFNFSYLSIPLLMWGLIGLIDLEELTKNTRLCKTNQLDRNISSLLLLIAVLPFIVVSFSFYTANQVAASGINTLNIKGNFEEGYQLLDRAIARDPFNKDFRLDMVRLQMSVGEQTQQQEWFIVAEENLQKAIKHTPYNEVILQQIAGYYTSVGNFEEASNYIERLVQTAPLRHQTYETKAKIYEVMGDYYRNAGQQEKSIEMYSKVLEVVEDAMKANKKAVQSIMLNQATLDTVFRARYIVENINYVERLAKLNDIVYISYLDVDVDKDGMSDGWGTWSPSDVNIKAEVTESGIQIANNEEDFAILRSPLFNMEPSKIYGVDVRVSKEIEDDYMALLIVSRNGTSIQFTQRPLGEPIMDNIYSFTFETTEDIEPGAQEVRFYHYGETDKSFTVHQVVLYEIKTDELLTID